MSWEQIGYLVALAGFVAVSWWRHDPSARLSRPEIMRRIWAAPVIRPDRT